MTDLYSLWLKNDRAELAGRVRAMQRAYDCLKNKDNLHARSLKAILDLRIQSLAVLDAAPRELPAAAPKGTT